MQNGPTAETMLERWLSYFALDMGFHGWLALILGVVGVAALNIGLMNLARRPWRPWSNDDAGDDRSRDD